ncbi:hypothetical protein KP509_02G078200 [Ceratopteris richardii]|uniref:Uncharacterized protein n=1 Tax=Ceratopteris richardii TaxID=49495 RepID=A0A8T2VIZ0_CERRI|nr:hypothetical protein KP509_02G078200 [Ceratopteris richardii]
MLACVRVDIHHVHFHHRSVKMSTCMCCAVASLWIASPCSKNSALVFHEVLP